MHRPPRYFVNPYPNYSGGPLPGDTPDLWKTRALDLVSDIQKNSRNVMTQDMDGGLYVGPGGVGYAFLDLAEKFQNSPGDRLALLDTASPLIASNFRYFQKQASKRDHQTQVGFLLGSAGIQAVAAYLAALNNDQDTLTSMTSQYAAMGDMCLPLDMYPFGSDELFVGRAGYLCGAIFLLQKLRRHVVPLDKLHKICDKIVESGRRYSQKKNSPSPLMYSYYDTEYLGAGHGLSSILQMLLSVPGFFEHNPSAESDVRQATNFIVSLQNESGNVPCAMDEIPPNRVRSQADELIHWCHGAPGSVYHFARAYLVWKDPSYLNAALRCGDCVWQRGLLRKGPGICHGVAGSGFVFLLLYRLTSDKKHLHRAHQFAEFLYTDEFKTARKPDCPFSLYEGTAGTLCFLGALIDPEKSSFPFFDVFI